MLNVSKVKTYIPALVISDFYSKGKPTNKVIILIANQFKLKFNLCTYFK